MFNMVSVDGYFADVNGGIEWHQVDDEFNQFAAQFIQRFDTALFGRKTYDLFVSYWPTALEDSSISQENAAIAQKLQAMKKIVVTSSRPSADWSNTEVWPEPNPQSIKAFKEEAGNDIVIYGSGSVVQQLSAQKLIDEYWFCISPIILGAGRQLFDVASTQSLQLIESRAFGSGNVLVGYSANSAIGT